MIESQENSMEKEKLRSEALKVLLDNRQEGVRDGKRFAYTAPSKEKYPNQFFWDSCFHAISYCELGRPDLAKEEIRTLLSAQYEDGLIPFQIAWTKKGEKGMYALFIRDWRVRLIQPPVLAQAVERIWQKTSDRTFLQEVLPGVKRFYTYLAEKRDPDRDDLVSIVSNLEAGWEPVPTFDQVLGLKRKNPTSVGLGIAYLKLWRKTRSLKFDESAIFEGDHFNVEDVGWNSIYSQGLESLSRLCKEFGDPDSEKFESLAQRVKETILEKCYDKESGLFFSLYSKQEKKAKVITFVSLMPIMLDIPKDIVERIVVEYISSPKHFWLTYPLSTVSASEPAFRPTSQPDKLSFGLFLWRGAKWFPPDWFLFHGLRKHGFFDLAGQLATKSQEVVSKSGFREQFDPRTGNGLGAHNIGLSTLVVNMI